MVGREDVLEMKKSLGEMKFKQNAEIWPRISIMSTEVEIINAHLAELNANVGELTIRLSNEYKYCKECKARQQLRTENPTVEWFVHALCDKHKYKIKKG